MTPYLGEEQSTNTDNNNNHESTQGNGLLTGTRSALEQLLSKAQGNLPEESLAHISKIHFSTANTGSPYFPSPLKQTEAISALKAVEAGVAASIADLKDGPAGRKIDVDLERATAFLFSTYLATLGGMDKANPKVKKLLKGRSVHYPVTRNMIDRDRYRSSASPVYPVPTTLSQSL